MKRWIRPLVLILVFFTTLVLGVIFMNKSNNDFTTSLEEATLPVVYFSYNDAVINELHGYTTEMDQCSVRDTITPITDDRLLHVSIATYGKAVNDIDYEIRSLDGSRLLSEGTISEYSISGNRIEFDELVENILDENEEYVYRMKLTLDGKVAYYYTRIERTSSKTVPRCLQFALKFHDYTLNGKGASFIPTYMDPATGDASTLNYVDLTCTLKQITWAKFEGQIVTDVVASIKEITDAYNVVTLNYVMSSVNSENQTEYYNVEEYYRLRDSETRMYVLNFERTMNQIYRGENFSLSPSGQLSLGIRSPEVNYKSNDAGNIVAFQQEGELWCYNQAEGNICRIFSFRAIEGIDARDNWNQHDIEIVSVDEAGSVTFVVYGYMNRGSHEGEVGVSVFRYDGLAHTIEELVFIPSNKSYEVLKAELGQLLYVNEMNQLFLIVKNQMYQVDLNGKKASVMLSDLSTDSYAVSESGRYIAYIDAEQINNASALTFMDLNTLATQSVQADEGCYIKPLEFIDEDLIYGLAKEKDILVDAAGNYSFGMRQLVIMETTENSLEEIKRYKPAHGFVESVAVDDYVIHVNIAKKGKGRYTVFDEDSIMNRAADTEVPVTIGSTIDEIKETQIHLQIKKSAKTAAKMITAQLLVTEADNTVAINSKDGKEQFFVYSNGRVCLLTDDLKDAIDTAYSKSGVVIDQNQNYIWSRAKATYVNPLSGLSAYDTDKKSNSVTVCVSAMLMRENQGIAVSDLIANGTPVFEVLHSTLKEYVVLDVSGCDLEHVLYYVNEGNPVFALTGDDKAVLITGYTSKKVYYFNPGTQSTDSMSVSDAEKTFKKAGNIFITYIK